MQPNAAIVMAIFGADLFPPPPRRPSGRNRSRARASGRSIWATLRGVADDGIEPISYIPQLRQYPY